MTRYLIIFAMALAAGGCVNDRIGQGKPPVPRPPEAPDAGPKIEDVGTSVGKVDASNRELEAKVAVLKREASTARGEATAAAIRSKALAEAGQATKEQLQRAWLDLQSLEARNLFLETETNSLGERVRQQAVEIVELRQTVTEAQTAVAKVESERDGLRLSLEVANSHIMSQNVAIANESARADKAEKRAAQANVYRRWVILGAICFAGIWLFREILPIVLRALKPA